MFTKKIIAILLILLGIASVGIGYYIQTEVDSGKIQLSSAQKKVQTGKGLLSLNPAVAGVGKKLTDSVDQKLAEANEEIAKYEAIAKTLQIGGAALAVIGGVLFFRKKNKW